MYNEKRQDTKQKETLTRCNKPGANSWDDTAPNITGVLKPLHQ